MQGPPLNIAKNESGEWQPPAIGFAKKCGVEIDQLTIEKNNKGQAVIAAKQFIKGLKSQDLLGEIFKLSIQKIRQPIAMKWGDNMGPFIRPIQWVCSLMDDQIIKWEVFGVKSSNTSYGHRFLTKATSDASSGAEISIKHANDYIDQLKKHHVLVSIQERKDKILHELEALMDISLLDQALLQEVTHLTECPTALNVEFSQSFLDLPNEVLVACLKKHQKAFMIQKDGAYINQCIVIADSVTKTNQDNIISGNKKVLLSRLNDVQFFWNEDLKQTGFSYWNQQLEKVVFQEGLGSVSEKTERIHHICKTISDQLALEKSTRDLIYRASLRCKADLVSQMVGELPSLQGIMGGYYAIRFNEVPEVAVAIQDHYCPRFEGDQLPTTLPGVIISIADRIDTMVACFENNTIPTGSRDPWGIRRSMIAIIRMMIAFDLNLNIKELIEDATLTLGKDIGENTQQCIQFFKPRIETVFLESEISHDMIQLLSNQLEAFPLMALKQASVLIDMKTSNPDQYQLLLDTTVRVSKIIQSFDGNDCVNESLFDNDAETNAYQSFNELKSAGNKLILNAESLPSVLSFCQVLSRYFDDVLIHAEDPNVAKNRQSFIKSVDTYFQSVGDWLKLQK